MTGNVSQLSSFRKERGAPPLGSPRQDAAVGQPPIDRDNVVIQPDAFRSSGDRTATTPDGADVNRIGALTDQISEINKPSWTALTNEQRAEVTDLLEKAGLEPHQERKLLDVLKGDSAKSITTIGAWVALVSSALAVATSEASASQRKLGPNTYER